MDKDILIASKRLEYLRPVLKKWIYLNRRLGNSWSSVGDAPWWHIERALVSLFAGAIWRSGGDAFEEYAEDKPGKGEGASGRLDMWFYYDKWDHKVEAKQCWVRSHKSTKALDLVVKVMGHAHRDAGNLNPDGMRRLAILFGAVRVPKSREKEMGEFINSSVKLAAHKKIKAGACAWVFPKPKGQRIQSGRYIYPGIIIWIREVQRSAHAK